MAGATGSMRRAAWAAVVATVCAAAPGFAQQGKFDWPQFLGPNRDGKSAETGLIDAWPDGGLKVVWRQPAGEGMSAVSIAGGKALTLTQHDDQQWLLCLDAETGRRLWETAFAAAYENGQGDGPRATPTVVDGQAFVYGGDGTLAALKLEDGALLWKKQAPKELKAQQAEYGSSSSPLSVGDLVVVNVGPGATVAAFRKADGAVAWKTGDDPAGYASPTLFTLNGAPQVVAVTGASVMGLSPSDGKLLWRHPYVTDYDCNTASAVLVDGKVLVSAGENHGSTLLDLRPTAAGVQAVPVWESLGSSSLLRNEWQTSILIDGHLYGFDNVGSAGPVTHLTCVNAKTWERTWQQIRFGKGNFIAADGKLFLTTMKGELIVVRATPESYQELGRQNLIGTTRQAPSLSNGLLYLRDSKEVVCVSVRKP